MGERVLFNVGFIGKALISARSKREWFAADVSGAKFRKRREKIPITDTTRPAFRYAHNDAHNTNSGRAGGPSWSFVAFGKVVKMVLERKNGPLFRRRMARVGGRWRGTWVPG